jgi:hypothetical protein
MHRLRRPGGLHIAFRDENEISDLLQHAMMPPRRLNSIPLAKRESAPRLHAKGGASTRRCAITGWFPVVSLPALWVHSLPRATALVRSLFARSVRKRPRAASLVWS